MGFPLDFNLLRKPFPAQRLAIMGMAKRWELAGACGGDCRVRWKTRGDRGDPPLRGALPGRRVDPRAGALLPRQRRGRRRAARGRTDGRCRTVVFSSTAAVYGTPDTTPIPEDAAAPADQPVWRDEAHVRGRARLVRPGLRAPQRDACGTSTSPAPATRSARTTTRDPPHPHGPGGGRARRAADAVRRRLPDAGRHLRPRLHRCRRPRRRAPAGHRGDRAGDARTDEPLVCNLGNGGGFSNLEVVRRRRAVVGREIPVVIGSATCRRSAGPRRVGRAGAEVLGWTPTPTLTRGDGRVGVGMAAAHPAATRTDPHSRLARLDRGAGRARGAPARWRALVGPSAWTSPLPAQSSRTGQTSHSPISIVTSRLTTAIW